MGVIFRFPFYALAVFLWLLIGGFITVIQLATIPLTMILAGLMPRAFGSKVKETLTFATFRRGMGNLNSFLRYGF